MKEAGRGVEDEFGTGHKGGIFWGRIMKAGKYWFCYALVIFLFQVFEQKVEPWFSWGYR